MRREGRERATLGAVAMLSPSCSLGYSRELQGRVDQLETQSGIVPDTHVSQRAPVLQQSTAKHEALLPIGQQRKNLLDIFAAHEHGEDGAHGVAALDREGDGSLVCGYLYKEFHGLRIWRLNMGPGQLRRAGCTGRPRRSVS